MPKDDLIIQGAPRRNWTGKMVLVKVGPNAFMRMQEDEARARGYTPVEPEQKVKAEAENKIRKTGRNKTSPPAHLLKGEGRGTDETGV